MTATRGSGTATERKTLLRRLRVSGRLARPLAIGAFVAALIVTCAVTGVLGAVFGGGDDGSPAPPAHIADTRSSWIPGQPSLATAAAYVAVAQRAEALAGERADARATLLKRLAAKKKADLKRARDEARKRYEALRRAALARYRAALRANARNRAEAAKKRAAALAKYRAAIKKYRDSLIIRPGEECKLASVRRQYDCASGTLPHDPIPGVP